MTFEVIQVLIILGTPVHIHKAYGLVARGTDQEVACVWYNHDAACLANSTEGPHILVVNENGLRSLEGHTELSQLSVIVVDPEGFRCKLSSEAELVTAESIGEAIRLASKQAEA